MTKNLAKQFTNWEDERADHQARYKKNGELQRKKKEEERQTVTNDKGQIHVDGFGWVFPPKTKEVKRVKHIKDIGFLKSQGE